MNITVKKFFFLLLLTTLGFYATAAPAEASSWSRESGYWKKTGGKFTFGLKHSLFSWLSWWTESREPQYQKEWEGFMVGIGKTIPYTATGLIQLVTFPVPVDFPNIGIGLHIPGKDCPARHDENWIPESDLPAASANHPL